jgi:UDP-GlcNAc:undecaprenyl-phosphate GlcNAc-1-phosphate transferase
MELAAFGLPLLISWLLTKLLLRWAPRLGLVDQPSDRKVHTRVIPLGGGLAIYAALVLTSSLPKFHRADDLILLGAGGVLVLLGLIDDWRGLPWQLRLGVQAIVALGTLALFASPSVLWLGVLFWILGLTNAFNMLDNMDALSSGVAAIVASLLAAGALLWPETDPSALPYLMLVGALLGFLWFNRPPARIFMGDAGSTFLGYYLSVRCLQGHFAELGYFATWIVPLSIMTIPWYDLASVVLIRLRQGRSPFHADKQHLSHRLNQLGLSRPAAVVAIHALTLATGLGGVLLYELPEVGPTWSGFALAAWWVVLPVGEGIARLLCRRSITDLNKENFHGKT